MTTRASLQIDRLGRPSIKEWCRIIELLAEQHPSLDAACASMMDLLLDLEDPVEGDWEADLRIRQALEDKIDQERGR